MSNDPTQQSPVQQYPNQQQYPAQYPGQQQFPGQQPAPAPRKSFFARHKILTAFLALVALIVVFSIAAGGGDTPDAGSTGGAPAQGGAAEAPAPDAPDAPAAEAPAPEAAPGIGTAVRDGKFEFTVTSVEPGVAKVGDEYLSVDAQGQFVLVHVTVTNIGDAAQMFDASSQKLFDDQGREHSADSTAGIYLGDANSFLNDINPGNSIEGVVIFDIPADAVPASVKLHDSFLSGGTTVTLG